MQQENVPQTVSTIAGNILYTAALTANSITLYVYTVIAGSLYSDAGQLSSLMLVEFKSTKDLD